PVAVLGLVFFAVMLVLQLPRTWARAEPAVRWGRVLWSLVGVGTAAWLIFAELFRLDAVCLWCTSVHVISLLVFIVTAFGTAATSPMPELAD
ncbi:MAG TPA: vitamin K epoxide reductase family protein, partial [Acidimicrobiales bacterium]|nr:vitamin K epoxide reductase family protein [Acidimicrobiales bacterium]